MTKGYLEPVVYNKGNNELMQGAERLRHQKESLVRFLNSNTQNLSEISEQLDKLLNQYCDINNFCKQIGFVTIYYYHLKQWLNFSNEARWKTGGPFVWIQFALLRRIREVIDQQRMPGPVSVLGQLVDEFRSEGLQVAGSIDGDDTLEDPGRGRISRQAGY